MLPHILTRSGALVKVRAMMKKLVISIFVLLTAFVCSCSRQKALFLYDQYYPVNFGFSDTWQKKLEKTAAGFGIRLYFQELNISTGAPPLTEYLEKSGQDIIVVTPLLSGRLRQYLLTAEAPSDSGPFFVDLGYRGKAVNSRHICIQYDKSEIYRKAGEAAGRAAVDNGYAVYAVFYDDTEEHRLFRRAFTEEFKLVAHAEPSFIELNADDANPQLPAMYLGIPDTGLFFIDAGVKSAGLLQQIPSGHYCAGVFLGNLRNIQNNLLFSVEYLPVVHFSTLLSSITEPETESGSDFFAVVRFDAE